MYKQKKLVIIFAKLIYRAQLTENFITRIHSTRSSRNGPGIIFQVFSNEFTAIWSITILLLIKSKIDHNYIRQIPISAAERLAIIKYNNVANTVLATGDSQQTVAIARARAIANQYTRAGAGEVWIGLNSEPSLTAALWVQLGFSNFD